MLTENDWRKNYTTSQGSGGEIQVRDRGKLVGSFDSQEKADEYIDRCVKIDMRFSFHRTKETT